MSILSNIVIRLMQVKNRKITDAISLFTSEKEILAVDFDGTLCAWAFPNIGREVFAVSSLLKEATELGYKIVIHSCRTNKHWGVAREVSSYNMIMWLVGNKIPFDAIWGMRYTNGKWEFSDEDVGKPFANFYLDDSATSLRELDWLLTQMKEVDKV